MGEGARPGGDPARAAARHTPRPSAALSISSQAKTRTLDPRAGPASPESASASAARAARQSAGSHRNLRVEWAIVYARIGWKILPLWPVRDGQCSCEGGAECRRAGKHPAGILVRHGLKDASADPVVFERWWRRLPDAGLAVATGPASGILVLDIDGPEGEASLAELEQHHGPLPLTCGQCTGGGRGGWQLFFQWPAGCSIRNSVGRVGAKLDVRGDSGSAVLPPTVTREPYLWFEDRNPWLLPPDELPPEWLDLLDLPTPPRPSWRSTSVDASQRRYVARAVESELALIASAPEGQRNDALNRGSHTLFRLVLSHGVPFEVIRDGLLLAALHAGLGEREAVATIQSAARARGLP